MKTVHVTFRLPVDLDLRMRDRRERTGVPTATFVRRLISAALDEEQSDKPKRRRSKIAG